MGYGNDNVSITGTEMKFALSLDLVRHPERGRGQVYGDNIPDNPGRRCPGRSRSPAGRTEGIPP